MKIVAIIAEFNPFHNGHAYIIREVRRLSNADYIIIVMSGDFVQRGTPAIFDKYFRTRMALCPDHALPVFSSENQAATALFTPAAAKLSGTGDLSDAAEQSPGSYLLPDAAEQSPGSYPLPDVADLVIELPTAIATGSAQRFAEGSIAILNALGCVDELWFGSESGDIALLNKIVDILYDEPEEYQYALKEFLRKGLSFPAARSQALDACIVQGLRKNTMAQNDTVSRIPDFMSQPNNILGLEYCLAIRRSGSSIKPHTIMRQGSAHNDEHLDNNTNMNSASAIRKAILQDYHWTILQDYRRSLLQDYHGECFNKFCNGSASYLDSPADGQSSSLSDRYAKYPVNVLKKAHPVPLCEDDFSEMLQYQLFREDADSLAGYLDISKDLARRIINHRNEFRCFSQFAGLLKTKNFTRTQINRALLHILLNIHPEDLETALDPRYIRILGFRKESSGLLSAIKKTCMVPMITNPAKAEKGDLITIHAKSTGESNINLDENISSLYDKDLFASNLYESIRARRNEIPFIHEYTRKIIIA